MHRISSHLVKVISMLVKTHIYGKVATLVGLCRSAKNSRCSPAFSFALLTSTAFVRVNEGIFPEVLLANDKIFMQFRPLGGVVYTVPTEANQLSLCRCKFAPLGTIRFDRGAAFAACPLHLLHQ